MNYDLDENFTINSNDITKITIKLSKGASSISYFDRLNVIDPYFTKYHPSLKNEKYKALIEHDSHFYKMISEFNVVNKNISFYIDDYYKIAYDNGSYILYGHPKASNNRDKSKIIESDGPNKERSKVICYPSSIKNGIEYYYNLCLKNSTNNNEDFLKEIISLTDYIKNKIAEIK
jgi:hypothetical protein